MDAENMFETSGLSQRAGSTARKVRVAVVLRPDEHDVITRAAKHAGLSVMSYLRGLALRAARELGIERTAPVVDATTKRQLELLGPDAVQTAERDAAQLVDEVLEREAAKPSPRGERIKPTRKRATTKANAKGPTKVRAKTRRTPKKPLRRGRK